MNTISTLQTVAKLDSENVFRRMLDRALDSSTESLLDWLRFAPELFGIETPRHAPIFAKKVNLPYYVLLSDDAQSTTVEKLCTQIEEECGIFCTYALKSGEGLISVYMASHEVDSHMLIDMVDGEEEDFDDEDEDDTPDFILNPEILVGVDVLVNGLLRTVVEVDADKLLALLDDNSQISIESIEVDELDGSYFVEEDEDEDETEDEGFDPASLDEDEEEPSSDDVLNEADEDDSDDADDDEFAEESPEVIVPQIREAEVETSDDDFAEEEVVSETVNDTAQTSESVSASESADEALAAAIAEEQAEQAQPIDWTRPPVEAVPVVAAVGAQDSADDTFAEEPQPEAENVAQNEAQEEPAAPVEPVEVKAPAIDGVSDSEQARRIELLETIKEQLPDDSVSEIKDNALVVLMEKGGLDYELSITVTQQLFANERMIDIFVLTSKDGSVGRRASNIDAILDVINSL